MSIIKNVKEVIAHLNEMLFTLNTLHTTEHLQNVIFEYASHELTRGDEYVIPYHSAKKIISAKLAKDFFSFIEENTNLYDEDGAQVTDVMNEENVKDVIAHLNDMLLTSNAESVAQHLDDMIFNYIKCKTRGESFMSEHEADRVMTAQRVRDFFYFYSRISNNNL